MGEGSFSSGWARALLAYMRQVVELPHAIAKPYTLNPNPEPLTPCPSTLNPYMLEVVELADTIGLF
jgi:hypothetical protein